MSGEEHDQPVGRLPDRRARPRDGGSAEDRSRSRRSAKGRGCSQGRAGTEGRICASYGTCGQASGRAEGHGSQATLQRAGGRDQERLPRRLSQGVCQRAARRCPGPRMPREEQGQGFRRLREGDQRRGRRQRGGCRSACRRRRCCDGPCGGRSGSRARRHRAAAAAAAPKATAAKQPSSAQVAAIKSACRADYPKVCASVPPGGAPALECLEKNKAKVSAGCEKAISAAAGGSAAAAAAPAGAGAAATAPAAAAPAAAPAVIVLRPLRPREELFIVRSACGADIRTLCAGVEPGGGRIIQCISSNAASLSPGCKDVLAPFAAR